VTGVSWQIGGYPVPLQWSDVSMSVPGGFGNLGQAVVPRESWPLTEGLFSLVEGTRTDGVPFYVGEVTGPPHVNENKVYLQVQGLQERLGRMRGRRLYQSRDLSKLVAANADPHVAGAYPMHTLYSVSTSDGLIDFNRAPGTYASGDRASVMFWAKDQSIYRVAFDVDRTNTMATWEIRLSTGTGPTGTMTDEGTTYGLTGTTTINVDATLTAVGDQLGISIYSTGAATPTLEQHCVIRNLRINETRVGASDTFTLSDLADDLAAEMNWDVAGTGSGRNMLPMDWESDWPSRLTEAATTCDCMWMVIPTTSDNDAALYVGDWGRSTWTVRGVDYSDVQPQIRYNKVAVAYTTPAGVPVESTGTADPDFYAQFSRDVYWPPEGPYQLSNRQYDSTNADAAVTSLLDYWSSPRVSGQIEIGRIWGPDGEAHPWDIDAGDLVNLPELDTLEDDLGPQRIIEVAKRVDGTSVISVGEATSLGALLADISPYATPFQMWRLPGEPPPPGKNDRRWKPSWKPTWHPKPQPGPVKGGKR
jgi:hypothetical protein